MHRRRWLWLVLALALAGSLAACSLRSPSSSQQPSFVDGLPSSLPSISEPPATLDPPSPTAQPTKSKSKPRATPTPEPPGPPPCAGFTGKNLSLTSVKHLLTTAAARQPWDGVQQPANLSKPLPKITVPVVLLKAIAAQESGWQSACKSNDHLGFGLFQVSAATESFVNNRFGEQYDRFKPADNVAIATDNLAWLLVYFGQFHFHETYSWSNTDLVDAVIASFNVGYGSVEKGDAIVISATARAYVDAVREQESPNADCQHWG
jgi:hypothetical protein